MSVQQGLDYVTTALAACFTWFSKLTSTITGSFGLIVSVFFLFLVVRLLLAPLIGAAVNANASDMVKSYRKSQNSGKSTEKE